MTKFEKLLAELDSRKTQDDKIEFLLEEMQKSATTIEKLSEQLHTCLKQAQE